LGSSTYLTQYEAAIGIDLGLKAFAIASIANHKYLAKSQDPGGTAA
jgi:hypothetical protein